MVCTMDNENHLELNSNQRKNMFLLILWLSSFSSSLSCFSCLVQHGVAVNNSCHCAVHYNCGLIMGDRLATITTTVEQVSRDFLGRSGNSSRVSSLEDCRVVNFY